MKHAPHAMGMAGYNARNVMVRAIAPAPIVMPKGSKNVTNAMEIVRFAMHKAACRVVIYVRD